MWKDAPHPTSSRKCKLKQQGATITHPLQWLESWTLTTPSFSEVTEQQEPSLLVWGQSRTATLGDNRVVSHKTKHTFTIQPGNCTLCYLSKVLKTRPYKKLHMDLYADIPSFITLPFIAFHRCMCVCVCVCVCVWTNWRQDPPLAERLWLTL